MSELRAQLFRSMGNFEMSCRNCGTVHRWLSNERLAQLIDAYAEIACCTWMQKAAAGITNALDPEPSANPD